MTFEFAFNFIEDMTVVQASKYVIFVIQAEVAQRLGFDQSDASKIEKGNCVPGMRNNSWWNTSSGPERREWIDQNQGCPKKLNQAA